MQTHLETKLVLNYLSFWPVIRGISMYTAISNGELLGFNLYGYGQGDDIKGGMRFDCGVLDES